MALCDQYGDFLNPRDLSYNNSWPNSYSTVEPDFTQILPHGFDDLSGTFDVTSEGMQWTNSNDPAEKTSSIAWFAPQELDPPASFNSFSGQSRHVNSRNLSSDRTRSPKLERKSPSSFASMDSDSTFSTEKDSDRHSCSECEEFFGTLQALDRHTQESSHKAWKCLEPGCSREYTRRDTFLRHRGTHGNNSHACLVCLRDGKQKNFKRKDHLGEHVRKCHERGTGSTGFVLWSLATEGDNADRTLGQARPPHKAVALSPDANPQA